MPRLYRFDFDNTIMVGHVHHTLAGEKLLQEKFDTPQAQKDYQEKIRNRMKDLLNSTPDMKIQNQKELADTFRKIIDNGDKISIESYSKFPEAMDVVLEEIFNTHPLTPADMQHMVKVTGFPEDPSVQKELKGPTKKFEAKTNETQAEYEQRVTKYRGEVGKELHTKRAEELFAAKGVIFRDKFSVLIDDDDNNVKKARADGIGIHVVPGTGLMTGLNAVNEMVLKDAKEKKEQLKQSSIAQFGKLRSDLDILIAGINPPDTEAERNYLSSLTFLKKDVYTAPDKIKWEEAKPGTTFDSGARYRELHAEYREKMNKAKEEFDKATAAEKTVSASVTPPRAPVQAPLSPTSSTVTAPAAQPVTPVTAATPHVRLQTIFADIGERARQVLPYAKIESGQAIVQPLLYAIVDPKTSGGKEYLDTLNQLSLKALQTINKEQATNTICDEFEQAVRAAEQRYKAAQEGAKASVTPPPPVAQATQPISLAEGLKQKEDLYKIHAELFLWAQDFEKGSDFYERLEGFRLRVAPSLQEGRSLSQLNYKELSEEYEKIKSEVPAPKDITLSVAAQPVTPDVEDIDVASLPPAPLPPVAPAVASAAVENPLETAYLQKMRELLAKFNIDAPSFMNARRQGFKTKSSPMDAVKFNDELKKLNEQHIELYELYVKIGKAISESEKNPNEEAPQYRERMVVLQKEIVSSAGKLYSADEFSKINNDLKEKVRNEERQFNAPLKFGTIHALDGGSEKYDLYGNKEFQENFRKHVASEFSSENTEFLLDLYKIQNNETSKTLDDVFKQYIPAGSESQINLPAGIMKNLHAEKDGGKLSLRSFQEAVTAIETLIRRDTFPRFQAKHEPEQEPTRTFKQKVEDYATSLVKKPKQKEVAPAPVPVPAAPKKAEPAPVVKEVTEEKKPSESKFKGLREKIASRLKPSKKMAKTDVNKRVVEAAQKSKSNYTGNFPNKKRIIDVSETMGTEGVSCVAIQFTKEAKLNDKDHIKFMAETARIAYNKSLDLGVPRTFKINGFTEEVRKELKDRLLGRGVKVDLASYYNQAMAGLDHKDPKYIALAAEQAKDLKAMEPINTRIDNLLKGSTPEPISKTDTVAATVAADAVNAAKVQAKETGVEPATSPLSPAPGVDIRTKLSAR